MKQTIAVLGATGSIGTQTLSVISQFKEVFCPTLLTCHSSLSKLEEISIPFPGVILGLHGTLQNWNKNEKNNLLLNNQEIIAFLKNDPPDILVIAVSGVDGYEILKEVYSYVKKIVISSKEILILAGINGLLSLIKKRTLLLPLDSEHVAIHQLIHQERKEEIQSIILTASGGPFFRTDEPVDFSKVTKEFALKHPTWNMGPKVTIDSATLVNKGIELIEARYLFGLEPSQINAIIHPESIIHSFCEFIDGSVTSQMAYPNMELPIAYSLFYPEKRKIPSIRKFDFSEFPKLTTRNVKIDTFPAIKLAKECMEMGGIAELIFLIADELAVDMFLNNKLSFLEIVPFIKKCLTCIKPKRELTIENTIPLYNEIKNRIVEMNQCGEF